VTYSRRLKASWPQMHWLTMNWLLLLRQPFEPHYSVGQSFQSVAAPMWWFLSTGATANQNLKLGWMTRRPWCWLNTDPTFFSCTNTHSFIVFLFVGARSAPKTNKF
jgi:hypothetical protein